MYEDAGDSYRSGAPKRGTVLLDTPVLEDEGLLTREKHSIETDAALVPTIFPILVGHSDDIKYPDGTARDLTRANGLLETVLLRAVLSPLRWTIIATGYDLDKIRYTNPSLLEKVAHPDHEVHFGSTFYSSQHPQAMNGLIPQQLQHGIEAIERVGLERSPVGKVPRFAYNDFTSPHSGGLASFVSKQIDYLLFEDRVSEDGLHPTLPRGTGSCFWLTDGATPVRALRFDSESRVRFKKTMRGLDDYTPDRFVDETLEDALSGGPARVLTPLYWRFEDIRAGGEEGVDRFLAVIEKLGSAVNAGDVVAKPLSREVLRQYEPLWDASHGHPIALGSYVWNKTPMQETLLRALRTVDYLALGPADQRLYLTLFDKVMMDAAYAVDTSRDVHERALGYRLLEEARKSMLPLSRQPNEFLLTSLSDKFEEKEGAILRARKRLRYQTTR